MRQADAPGTQRLHAPRYRSKSIFSIRRPSVFHTRKLFRQAAQITAQNLGRERAHRIERVPRHHPREHPRRRARPRLIQRHEPLRRGRRRDCRNKSLQHSLHRAAAFLKACPHRAQHAAGRGKQQSELQKPHSRPLIRQTPRLLRRKQKPQRIIPRQRAEKRQQRRNDHTRVQRRVRPPKRHRNQKPHKARKQKQVGRSHTSPHAPRKQQCRLKQPRRRQHPHRPRLRNILEFVINPPRVNLVGRKREHRRVTRQAQTADRLQHPRRRAEQPRLKPGGQKPPFRQKPQHTRHTPPGKTPRSRSPAVSDAV
ncbi:phage associated protein [Neisseria gonorrhoeae DGI18]|nr:phage associated protein [Neisseria gonorrhoeae DGI18]